MADDKNGAIERPVTPAGAPQNPPHKPQAHTLLRPAAHPNAASSGSSTNTNTGSANSSPSASDWQVTNPSQWDGADKVTLSAGSILKERFTLERIVGKGGMGTVFCARDRRKEEAQDRFPYVAVKLLNEDFKRHPESLKLLQREARKAQQLAHPNIVTVYDFDRDGANVFIVMELLQGESLDRVIKQTSKGLSVPDALRIVIELGKALSYAHEKGVIHLDFKPANAHLCRDGTVKVLDFGIARAQQRSDLPEQEQTLFQVGDLGALTPSYASLEMQAGDDPDPRDDVYALACVTYELLTGKHPFGRQSAQFALEYKLWPTRPKGLSRNGWQALQRALALRRAQRTPSINEFVTELSAKQRSVPRWTVAAVAVAIMAGAVTYWQWPAQVSPPMTTSATKSEMVPTVQHTPTVAAPSPPPTAESPTTHPPSVTQPDVTQKGQGTVEQQRERLTQLARRNDIVGAMAVLTALRAELPNDPFVTQDAPQAIAAAALRLAERAMQQANYAASSDYILAARRLSPDARAQQSAQQSKDALIAITRLDSSLRHDRNLTAELLRKQLAAIQSAVPNAYPAVEINLASVLAARIERERRVNVSSSDALLAIATQVFGHIPAIAALNRSTPAKTAVATRVETTTPAQPTSPPVVADKPVTQTPPPESLKAESVKRESAVQSTKPVEPPKEETKPKKKDKPNVITTF